MKIDRGFLYISQMTDEQIKEAVIQIQKYFDNAFDKNTIKTIKLVDGVEECE